MIGLLSSLALPKASTVAKMAGGGLVVLLIVGGAYYLGFQGGKAKIQVKWDKDIQARQELVDKHNQELDQREFLHRQETNALSHQLRKTDDDHGKVLAAVAAAYDRRLSDSEKRASVYRQMSDAGSSERGDLARHAAELDRALEQGRALVEELRATLGQREDQLRLLGQQIITDRELVGDKNND